MRAELWSIELTKHEDQEVRPFKLSDLSILGVFLIPAGIMIIHYLFDPSFRG